ncbi:sodium/glutamate symport carrier protein [Campylobacter iguaniorum]|uniref:Sodium/glutamate symporter n=1 Tax=Campylobacter iguaniorum TaxID=1244531 RepID=A0A076FAM3_9BACT|nr:sodium/glutamate symporter [Campylobacter iguaniorum]AII14532.1 sodium/glutamate symport carrier protein [Campylobacter iguaniorum]ALV24268.1 sodium/glutamate symport carrier protein [Campylobacter iguaniorum]
MQTIEVDFYGTLVVMVLVLLLGIFIIKRVKFLQDYNIPEPVVGGIIAAIFFLCLYSFGGITLKFDGSLKDPLMLAFFSSIGLLADFASLKKGGKKLVIFLFVISGLLVLQNVVGISVALGLGENPLIGLLGGSVTMSGGHGTGAAWAGEFIKEPYGFSAAYEVAMASATFGLIAGGIIGGPVARYLINKNSLKTPDSNDNDISSLGEYETPHKEKLITQKSFIESLALLAFCLLIGNLVAGLMKSANIGFTLPTFVYCLFTGVILRNVLSSLKIYQVFDREVSVLGNVSLSLFLAFALMTINLWQLVSLALPIFTILVCQVALMAAYAIFVTFRFCGRDYDAAVLAAGHCGFGLGATPTAMVNMQTVTNHYGMSHMAFIIVPLCGAFFIDIVNALVINGFLSFLG